MTAYNLLFTLHMIAIAAAFGPLLAYPLINRQAGQKLGAEGAAIANVPVALLVRFVIPAMFVATLAGIGLILTGNGFTFAQAWVSASFTIVIVLFAVAYFMARPALVSYQRAVGGADVSATQTARAKAAMSTGILHIGFVALVVLMVWKPGA